MTTSLFEFRGLRKSFGPVTVLDGIDLDLGCGEVHSLVGENGAGKSTLMRIAAGIHKPDEGAMTFLGVPFAPRSPSDALQAGIAMVHQELSLAPDVSVAENILVGREPRRACFIDWNQLHSQASAMLEEFCPAIDPTAPLSTLGLGYRQIVEIVKALAWNPRVIIFDEPTSSLESQETELLLETIARLKSRGVGVVYISHRMDEVFRISDRITVLRDGRLVGTWRAGEVSRQDVLNAMVGRQLTERSAVRNDIAPDPLLTVSHLSQRGHFEDISFVLHRGEILGFSGLVGAGRTELMRAIFAAEPADGGDITLDGQPCRPRFICQAIEAGLAYLPEDRKTQGLFLTTSLEENMICGNLGRCSLSGILRPSLSRQLSKSACRQLNIRANDVDQEIGTLSGGNQQKVLLARWMAAQPKVLMVDEPTRGIDVGAKAEIHQLLRDYARAGHGVMVASSEMPELLGLCDRIIVMHEGRLAGELPGATATENELIQLATGSGLSKPGSVAVHE